MGSVGNAAFSVEFFALQLCFAQRVAALSGVPLAHAVGSHTNLGVRLGMGPQLDPGNADWQDFLARLATAQDKAAYAHAVHVERLHLPAGPTLAQVEGCFSYALIGPDRVRLHFHARADADGSPLSKENLPQRQRELARLFATLSASAPGSLRVVGASWLYNLPGYRSLFPAQYLGGLRPLPHPHQRLPLWGQFLHRDRRVRPDAAARFLEGIARASTLPALDACFTFPVLTTTAPLACFAGR